MARKAGIEDYLRMMLGPQPKQHIAKTAADMLFGGVAQAPPPNASLADQAMHALAQPGVMPIGMTAWHGTPHKFAPTPKNPYGEFDLSKIGTGEGAQAYGHGMYLAEEPAVARNYAVPDRSWQQIKSGRKPKGGTVYKVDLPDEAVGRMLDWDAPLSQQPRAAQEFAKEHWHGNPSPKLTGKDIYYALGFTGPANLSREWAKRGVPGLKYFDQSSRGAGAGTRNFVMFDTSPLNILGVE